LNSICENWYLLLHLWQTQEFKTQTQTIIQSAYNAVYSLFFIVMSKKRESGAEKIHVRKKKWRERPVRRSTVWRNILKCETKFFFNVKLL